MVAALLGLVKHASSGQQTIDTPCAYVLLPLSCMSKRGCRLYGHMLPHWNAVRWLRPVNWHEAGSHTKRAMPTAYS